PSLRWLNIVVSNESGYAVGPQRFLEIRRKFAMGGQVGHEKLEHARAPEGRLHAGRATSRQLEPDMPCEVDEGFVRGPLDHMENVRVLASTPFVRPWKRELLQSHVDQRPVLAG